MSTKKPSTELTKVQDDPTADVPAMLDFGSDAGLGFENQTQADISIPFLNVLQALSPQVTVEDSPYKAGMIFNTVTQESWKGSTGLTIIPVDTEHKYVEYVPRLQGGGFVGVYEDNSPVVERAKKESTKFGKYKTPAGNDLVETFYMYAMDAETGGYFIIAFSSTKIKPYKDWKACVNMFNHRAFGIPGQPPLFSNVVRLTTEKETRKGGESYNFRLNPANPGKEIDGKMYPPILMSMIGPKDVRYQKAKEFYNMIKAGKAEVNHESNINMSDHTDEPDMGNTKACPF